MSQEVVRWEPTLESAQRLAAQTNRLVLVYFCGPSCVYCRRMEAEVLSQPAVAAAINVDYVAVKVVADYFPTTAKRYNVTHLPTTVVVTPQGQWLDSKEGYVATGDYVARLGRVALEAKRRREAIVAQAANGPAPSATSQPAANEPVANRPATLQPTGNPAIANQANGSQPSANPAMPMGQPPFGPAVAGAAMPAGVSPPYGGSPNAVAPPPTMAQQPPAFPQQPPAFQQQPPALQQQSPTVPQPCLDGCCPVSLVEKGRWISGDRRWGMYHLGRLYFFAGPEEQRRFFADPDRYAPILSGNDVVLAAEGQVVPGRRQYGVFCMKKVYLFSSEATRAKFEANPGPYVNQALQALRSRASCPPGTQWR
jgi:YHS domain-containing protein/thiol-disulfide isomerase/thioredoxin